MLMLESHLLHYKNESGRILNISHLNYLHLNPVKVQSYQHPLIFFANKSNLTALIGFNMQMWVQSVINPTDVFS